MKNIIRYEMSLALKKLEIVKFSLSASLRHGSIGIVPLIHDLSTRWRQLTSWSSCFTLGRNPCTHWIGSWVGYRASLGIWKKRKISCPYQDSNPALSSLYPSRYTHYASSAPQSWGMYIDVYINHVTGRYRAVTWEEKKFTFFEWKKW